MSPEEEEQPAEAALAMMDSIVSISMNPQPELFHDYPHNQRDFSQPAEASPIASIEPGEQDQSAVAEHTPQLVFHPRAWLKLQFFCHARQSEVRGFVISAEHDQTGTALTGRSSGP